MKVKARYIGTNQLFIPQQTGISERIIDVDKELVKGLKPNQDIEINYGSIISLATPDAPAPEKTDKKTKPEAA